MLFRSLCLLLAVQCARVDSCKIDLKAQGITDDTLVAKLNEAYVTTGCPANACTYLNLHDNDIEVFPSGTFDSFTSLKKLRLSWNAIKVWPADSFKPFASVLEYLSLFDNDFAVLPAGILDEYTALQFLELNGMEIVELPDKIFDLLTNLEQLNLDRNNIVEIPDGIFDSLTKLDTLELDRNEIVELPAGIFDNLKILKELTLNNNTIAELPDGIFDSLTILDMLDLSGTDIEGFPTYMFEANPYIKDLRLPVKATCSSGSPTAGVGQCYTNKYDYTYLSDCYQDSLREPCVVPLSDPSASCTTTVSAVILGSVGAFAVLLA